MFDLDDTLLDFRASERLSFETSLSSLTTLTNSHEVFESYQKINRSLWESFERAEISKDHLRVDRFRQVFDLHQIELDPELASERYLQSLPETVVLMDQAKEICQHLASIAQVGIITNGMHQVQLQRISNSPLAPYFSFIAVSEECGHAKPDIRFFEYSSKMAHNFEKQKTLVIGDRLETDILGANIFGVDSCWFNPKRIALTGSAKPNYEIKHLSELHDLL